MAGPTQGNPRSIFLSYRRDDSQPWTGRLNSDLRSYFGQDRVYFDLNSTRSGQDYITQVKEALSASRVAIAVIGPDWADSHDATGRRRILDPNDLLRQELEFIFRSGIALLVVLVGGASMPTPEELPDSLRALSTIQRSRMADEDWQYDLGRLLEDLSRHGLSAKFTDPKATQNDWKITYPRGYKRTIKATRRRGLDAVIGAVEASGYRDRKVFPEAAQVTFTASGRTVSAKVIDAGAGTSTIVVEIPSLKTEAVAVGASVLATMTFGLGVLAWPGLRLWERSFATGFLDNVQAVLEGRDVTTDPSSPQGAHDWRRRKRQV